MEPTLITEPKNVEVLKELMHLESIFYHPEVGMTRQDFEKMTDPTFWEVGASGRRYSREYVLDVLDERRKNPIKDIFETKDSYCLEIAPDNYLITYTLHQEDRITRRASFWRRTEREWKIVYHQGTVVQEQ